MSRSFCRVSVPFRFYGLPVSVASTRTLACAVGAAARRLGNFGTAKPDAGVRITPEIKHRVFAAQTLGGTPTSSA
jgi:hypothetical protein